MIIRVHYIGQHYIDYEEVETFYFHDKYLCLEEGNGETVFINSDQVDCFRAMPAWVPPSVE